MAPKGGTGSPGAAPGGLRPPLPGGAGAPFGVDGFGVVDFAPPSSAPPPPPAFLGAGVDEAELCLLRVLTGSFLACPLASPFSFGGVRRGRPF